MPKCCCKGQGGGLGYDFKRRRIAKKIRGRKSGHGPADRRLRPCVMDTDSVTSLHPMNTVLNGLTENDRHENDGPWKLQDMKLQDKRIEMQFSLLLLKHATLWCTLCKWLSIKKRQYNVAQYKQFIGDGRRLTQPKNEQKISHHKQSQK